MQIPKNVIQTGETDPCHKIYMEDYVHTLLTQYRENEADFCLYGKREQEGEISYYFIYGAAKEEPGWELMESRYFALQRRIGEVTFDEKEAWAFFEDGYSAPLDGYFIFYEQNEDMQSYLIAMHQNQPGEKTVEVRHRAARKPENSPEEMQEPRRIRRSPMAYDLKNDRQSEEKEGKEENGRAEQPQEEKVIHAAQTGREAALRLRSRERSRADAMSDRTKGSGKAPGRARSALLDKGRSERRTSFRIKAAALAVLLGLCAAAVTSVNGYQDAEEAGNFFGQALDELRGESGNGGNGSGSSGGGTLIVEETQLAPSEDGADAATAETLPVLSTDVFGQEETSVDVEPASESEQNTEVVSTEETASAPVTEADTSQEAGSSTAAEGTDTAAAEMTEADGQAITSEQAATAGTVSYIVQRGDNLAAICRRQYGNTDRVEEIAALNQLDDPNHLIPGQEILLPQE